jgi:hypothetical protein
MGENDQFFGRRETGEDLDTTASGCPKRAAQVISGFDGDAALEDRRAQHRGLAAGIARRLRCLGKRFAISLREVLSRDSAIRPSCVTHG